MFEEIFQRYNKMYIMIFNIFWRTAALKFRRRWHFPKTSKYLFFLFSFYQYYETIQFVLLFVKMY